MGIVNKKIKIIVSLILLLEIIFLIRTYIIYSFYQSDEMYGDGVHDVNKYDKDMYNMVLSSIAITIFLLGVSILFIRKKKK